jgi:hypothetical protein
MKIAFPRALPALFALIFLLGIPVSAHEPGLSTAMVTVDKDTADVILTFSSDEVDALSLSLRTGAEGEREDLAKVIMTISGRAPTSARTDLTNAGDVVFHLGYTGLTQGAFTIEAPLLTSFVPGHRQYLLVRDEMKHLLLRHFLTPDESAVTVENSPD